MKLPGTINPSHPKASVSVLMPCLNPGVFLLEAVDSVLVDPAVLELIVADGGSTDGSVELLQQRAALDRRLRLVCEPDSGPPEALNRAFALARGTVIGWLNADDRYLPEAASRAVDALELHPEWLLVYGEGQHIDAEGVVLDLYPTRPPEVGLEGFRDYCFLCQPTVFWRRSLGVMLGPFELSLKTCFDFDYWIRAFTAFPGRIGHLPVLQAQTRRHGATISATQLPRAVMEATLLQAPFFDVFHPHILHTYIQQILEGEIQLPDEMTAEAYAAGLLAIAHELPFNDDQVGVIEAVLEPLLMSMPIISYETGSLDPAVAIATPRVSIEPMLTGNRTCVVFQMYERDVIYRDNLIFFLLVGYRVDLDFFVLLAGDSDLEIPVRENIRVVRGDNYGHDFGSVAQAVIGGMDLSRYDFIIFLNASVRGPFLPPYYHGDWSSLFTDSLQGDTHLCGATINVMSGSMKYHALYRDAFDHPPPYSHVQSYAYAMTQECFRYLAGKGVWEACDGLDKDTVIVQREIRISQEVKASGWNLRCFLPPYNWIDYRQAHCDPNPASDFGHPVSPGSYFGSTLHPYEVVFVKTGWGVASPERLDFYSAIALRARPATLLGEWQEAQILLHRLCEVIWPTALDRCRPPAPSSALSALPAPPASSFDRP